MYIKLLNIVLQVKGLAQLAVELDFLVEEYAGSRGRFPPIKHLRRCLYIATIEKAHSLVNSLLEQDRLGSLGLVVVDEVRIYWNMFCGIFRSCVGNNVWVHRTHKFTFPLH